MTYTLLEVNSTAKHIYFTIQSEANHTENQLVYEAEVNRNFKMNYRSNDENGNKVYRISKSKWPKLQSYIRGVNKLNRFQF